MSSVIVADQLTKWYGPRLAVDRVSLEVRAGEVLGLLGPNGSGKTTILRILTGYLRPSSGTVSVAGLDIIDDALAVKRRVGYVPENAPLYDGMRVREFLELMARIKGKERASVPAAVDGVCGRLDLTEVARRQIGTLSKGFRQRVAIAQALLGTPDILILDEPGNGLDPRQIIELRELIRSLAGPFTVLVTSHILGEIERVADRAAILLAGRLLAIHPLRGSDAGRRLRVEVRGDPDRVRSRLGQVAGVGAIVPATPSRQGVSAYLLSMRGPDLAERVAAALVDGGFGLAELRDEPVDLETLFLELTGAAPARPTVA
jgi:gliding motility-associated transport system ATP-binding protein